MKILNHILKSQDLNKCKTLMKEKKKVWKKVDFFITFLKQWEIKLNHAPFSFGCNDCVGEPMLKQSVTKDCNERVKAPCLSKKRQHLGASLPLLGLHKKPLQSYLSLSRHHSFLHLNALASNNYCSFSTPIFLHYKLLLPTPTNEKMVEAEGGSYYGCISLRPRTEALFNVVVLGVEIRQILEK